MTFLKKIGAALFGAILACGAAQAAYPVSISASGSDAVETVVLSYLMQDIDQTPNFRLVDATDKSAHFIMEISSVSIGENDNYASAIGVTFIGVPKDIYFSNAVLVCGISRASLCARMILGDLQKTVSP